MILALDTPPIDWFALAPTLALLTAGALNLILAVLWPRSWKRPTTAVVCALGFAGAIVAAALLFSHSADGHGVIADVIQRDRLGALTAIIIAGAGLLAIGTSYSEPMADDHIAEYYALLAWAGAGMIFLASASTLLTLFLGLEWFSISLYILCAIDRDLVGSLEAGLKYLIIGGFGSAMLLFGSALVYGATGQLEFGEIARVVQAQDLSGDALLVAGLALLIGGLGFKASAAPFHMWTPDVYEGAPTPITGFMSVAVKAAAFAAWARILLHKLSALDSDWLFPLWIITIATMTFGNLLAISQSSVKRMLAYSSIAHAGYLLIPIVVGAEWGGLPLLFYVLTYSFMTIGAFAVLSCLSERDDRRENYSDFAGLGFKRPFLGLAMSLFMLSLAGFPPLGGFAGKFYIFRAAVLSGHVGLAIIGVLNSLLSVIYYLRVIVAMYMEDGGAEGKSFRQASAVYIAIALAAIATLYLGILPASALSWSRIAFASLE